MARKKSAPPSLFCEWMVGTTISAALGPLPRKPPKRREVVTVEVLTDDETEEDTLMITYPRSGGSRKVADTKDAAVKKVRFEDAPKKSAMKKVAPSASEDSEETGPEAQAAAESSDSSNATSDDSQPTKKANGKKPKKAAAKSSDSEDDSEPHPTCKCNDCVRGRQKQQQSQGKKCAKKSETLDSETEEPKKSSKKGGKGKKNSQSGNKGKGDKVEVENSPKVEAESSAASETESAKDTEDEAVASKEKKKEEEAVTKENHGQGAKKDKNKGQDEQSKSESAKTDVGEDKKDKNKGQDEQSKSESAKTDEGEDKKEAEAPTETPPKNDTPAKGKKPPKTSKAADDKKPSYPAGFPGPHARRPNLIVPIRAEVVHTERVVETPEDPPPNAYYDSENNIVRIYHGPAYGHHHGSLYPKRDPSHLPLPIGMPHPTRNPYYHGFDRGPENSNLEHFPITQGMGMHVPAVVNAYCPPHGYAGYYPGAFMPPGGPPPTAVPPAAWPAAEPAAVSLNMNKNKGAFSMPALSSKDQDVTGGDNVFPPGKQNPYYPPKRSPFSNLGASKGCASNGSPRHSNTSKKAPSLSNAQQQSDQWGNSPKSQDQAAAAAAETGWDNGGQGQDGACPTNGADQTENSGGETAPANNQTETPGDTWGNQEAQQDNDGGGDAGPGWGQTDQQTKDDPPLTVPGGWITSPSAPVPSWADPSMAASTGGQVNCW
ncbi:hypothetical protein EsDP_00004144 [Epichloe bromicola]|uniref:Uncharacterized protein n=1 Tax=Epichloe bromicola TaxID=79588 RepID=A0ABQ0CQV1_9HYPO